MSESMIEVRRLSGAAGLRWLVRGWQQMKQSLGMWLLVSLAFLGIQILAALALIFIPFIGQFAHACLVSPPLMLGFFYCAAVVYQTQTPPEAENIFFGFRNGRRFGRIVGTNLLWMIVGIAVFILLAIFLMGILYAINPELFSGIAEMGSSVAQGKNPPEQTVVNLQESIGVGQILLMIIAFLIFMAGSIIFQHGLMYSLYFASLGRPSFGQIMSLGLRGSFKNILPLFVVWLLFALTGLGLVVVVSIIFGLFSLLGIHGVVMGLALMAIPVGFVIMLGFMAWGICTAYAGFQEIFEGGDIVEETVQV